MCNICLYWLRTSREEAEKCDGLHWCWASEDAFRPCGGRIQGELLPGSIGCSRGHGSCGIVVYKEKPGFSDLVTPSGERFKIRPR